MFAMLAPRELGYELSLGSHPETGSRFETNRGCGNFDWRFLRGMGNLGFVSV